MDFFKEIKTNFYSEPSSLKVSSIVDLKRSQGRYNFKRLPKTAILVPSRKSIGHFSKRLKKRIKGLSGANYLFNSSLLVCSEIGTGAPAALVLLEELRSLGVERFIFMGIGGRLSEEIGPNEARIIATAHSSTGSSSFYSSKNTLRLQDHIWITELKNQLGLNTAVGWSTDCPYRETASIIQYYKGKSAQLVDMECAAIYAFSEFYNLPTLCILIGADSLFRSNWQPPEDLALLTKKQREILTKLLSLQYSTE